MDKKVWLGAALAVSLYGSPAIADVWDAADAEDDSTETDNELVHGAVQVHDLWAQGGVTDQDWYRVTLQPYSSIEFIVEGLVGNLYAGDLPVDLIGSDGTTVLTSSFGLPSGLGATRVLVWENNSATAQADYIRVTGANACGTVCTVNDQYTIRFYDTTASIARFNNAGTQLTVLIFQNTTNSYNMGFIRFWDSNGVDIGSWGLPLAPKSQFVLNTLPITGHVGGSITVLHTAGYGGVQGKAVAVEPATGFTFDTPLVYKPH